MCLSGESSDAIIFRKSRIKLHETYCTKLLIPRSLLFRHNDLKSLSRDLSRVRSRKSETSRSSYKNRTLKLNSILIWPTLFTYQKNCCNYNSYLLISAANGRFFVRRKRANFKNRKSFERAAVIDAVILLVSVVYHAHVLWNQTSLNPPAFSFQVYLSFLSFLTAFLKLKTRKEKLTLRSTVNYTVLICRKMAKTKKHDNRRKEKRYQS